MRRRPQVSPWGTGGGQLGHLAMTEANKDVRPCPGVPQTVCAEGRGLEHERWPFVTKESLHGEHGVPPSFPKATMVGKCEEELCCPSQKPYYKRKSN